MSHVEPQMPLQTSDEVIELAQIELVLNTYDEQVARDQAARIFWKMEEAFKVRQPLMASRFDFKIEANSFSPEHNARRVIGHAVLRPKKEGAKKKPGGVIAGVMTVIMAFPQGRAIAIAIGGDLRTAYHYVIQQTKDEKPLELQSSQIRYAITYSPDFV